MYIIKVFEYKKHLSILENEIDALAKSIEEFEIIQSIPGIGEKIAATIVSEIELRALDKKREEGKPYKVLASFVEERFSLKAP